MSVKRKKCENKQWPQDKGDVKTEGVKSNIFNRKRSQNKSVKQQETRKMVPNENLVKRMRCGEKRMSREAGLKKKRRTKIRMPRERLVRKEECVKSLAPELSTRRAVKIQKCQEQAGSRESGSIRQRCREQEMSRTKTSKRSRSQRLCQPGGQALFLQALPCLHKFFPLLQLPSPSLPRLYLYGT